MSKLKVNKKHKDKLFRKIFRKKKDLLALYNALNGTAYTNEEDLEITTLEDVVYMGMKNDTSFIIDHIINLYEHQSSFSPNLPLRGLLYFADLYPPTSNLSKDVFIPKPRYSFQHHSILYSIMVQKISQKGRFYILVIYLYRKRKLRLWNVLLLC